MLPMHRSPSSTASGPNDQPSDRTLVHDDPLARPPIPSFDAPGDGHQQQHEPSAWRSPSSSNERSPPVYYDHDPAGRQPHDHHQPQHQAHGRVASGSGDGRSSGDGGSSDLGHTYVGSSTAALNEKYATSSSKQHSPEDEHAYRSHHTKGSGSPYQPAATHTDEDGRATGYAAKADEFGPPRPSYLTPLDPGSSDDDSDLGTATETDDEFDWDVSDGGGDDAGGGKGETAESIARGGLGPRNNGGGGGHGVGKHRARRGRRIYLWLMGLSRWFRTLLVACVGAAILITPFAVVMTEFRDSAARSQVQVWSIFLCISFVFGCVTVVVVDFLPHLFTIAIYWINGKVPENLKTYVELLMALSLYTKLFLCSAWSWITFSVTRAAVSPSGNYWVYINRVLEAIFAALLVLLAEKLLLQVIAINFHRTSLRDRLDENGEALRALDKLSHAVGRFKKRPGLGGRTKSGGQRDGSGSASAAASRPGTPGPPPPPMSGRTTPGTTGNGNNNFGTKAQDYARSRPHSMHHGRSPLAGGAQGDPTITTASDTANGFEGGEVAADPAASQSQVKRSRLGTLRDRRKAARARKSASKVVSGLGRQLKQVALLGVYGKGPEIGSLSSARQLAKKLFDNLERGNTDKEEPVLLVEDFIPYFRNEEDAAKAFKHFDSDGNGDISKREMRAAVQRIYKERKALTASLADMSSAISKLDGVLLVLALIICIFIFLLIFNKTSTVESLVPVSTFVLGFSFIFSNSAKTLFESLIFIFATHPFDVGDLVLIDSDFLFVKEFGLVSTTFRRWDAQEIIAPNALLATTKLIHNVRRSRAMWEVCSIQVSYDTPLEVLEEINIRVKQYLVDNNREWGGGHQVNINNIANMNVIHLDIAIEHKSNWQDWGAKWMRRTLFLKHLKTILHSLEVTYSLPVQPIVLPAGSENLQQFASNLFPGREDALGNAGGHHGTLSASPYRNAPPQSSSGTGGFRPSLSVQTAGFAR